LRQSLSPREQRTEEEQRLLADPLFVQMQADEPWDVLFANADLSFSWSAWSLRLSPKTMPGIPRRFRETPSCEVAAYARVPDGLRGTAAIGAERGE
jgi:hypothetical protein